MGLGWGRALYEAVGGLWELEGAQRAPGMDPAVIQGPCGALCSAEGPFQVPDRPPSFCVSLQPPQYKLDPRLARLLGVHTQTRASIMQALWLYIKHNKLQDSHEKEYINCNRYFRQVSPRPIAPACFAGRRAPFPPPVRPEEASFLARNRHSRLPSLNLCPFPRLWLASVSLPCSNQGWVIPPPPAWPFL